MKKEVKEHINAWQDRLARYNDINIKAIAIESKVVKLISTSDDTKKRPIKDTRITPIELPAEIN
jgi:hypothetical protein